jgi:hypothetical protein
MSAMTALAASADDLKCMSQCSSLAEPPSADHLRLREQGDAIVTQKFHFDDAAGCGAWT